MSDALLERLAKAAEGILAHIQKGGGAAVGAGAGATKPATPPAGAADAAKVAAAAKAKAEAAAKAKADAEAVAKAAAAAAAKAKPAAGPVAGTKGPNGKFTVEQVREKIREVASNANLGRDSAKDILDQDGGGVKSIKDLKPENYDKVYEACQVALQSEGAAPGAAPAEEDDFA